MDNIAHSPEENQSIKYKLNTLYQPMTEHFGVLAHVFDLLTPKKRRVLNLLFDVELKRRGGKGFEYGIYIGVKKISKVAKVSERTTQRLFSQFKNDPFLDSLLKIKYRKDATNLYEMSELLFLFLGYLKMEGAVYQWERHRARILGYVSRGNDIIINRLQLRFKKLSTSVCHHLPSNSVTLLNVFTKYFLSINKVLTANASEVPSRKEEFNRITFSFGRNRLNLQQKKYLLASVPITYLDKAIADKRFYEAKGNSPKNDFALIYSRVKYHQTKRS